MARQLDNLVKRSIHHIGVVAQTAHHAVSACAAYQAVVAIQAGERVIACQAVDGVVARGAGEAVTACAGDTVDELGHRHGSAAVEYEALHVTNDGDAAPCVCQPHVCARRAVYGVVGQVVRKDGCVVACTAVQRVVAITAIKGVVACTTVEDVVARVAGQNVVARVTGEVDEQCGIAGDDGAVLYVQAQRVGACRGEVHQHGVGGACACGRSFGDGVACYVHLVGVIPCAAEELVCACASDECVVACAALKGVGTCAAAQLVGLAVAGEFVGQVVTGEVDCRAGGDCSVFYVGCKGVGACGKRYVHRVGAAVGQLHHLVACHIHFVGVVACAAYHAVVTRAAQQRVVAQATVQEVVSFFAVDFVVARQAIDDVGARGADDGVLACAGRTVPDFCERFCDVRKLELLHVAHQGGFVGGDMGQFDFRRGSEALHRVLGEVAVEHRHITAHAAVQRVVAATAAQGVVACAAVEDIVASVAGQYVVARVAGQVHLQGWVAGDDGAVFYVQAQCVGACRCEVHQHGVSACACGGSLGDGVACHVHLVGIVPCTAKEFVCACAANERVVACAAFQGVRTYAAVKDVIRFVASEFVGQHVAREVDCSA